MEIMLVLAIPLAGGIILGYLGILALSFVLFLILSLMFSALMAGLLGGSPNGPPPSSYRR